MAEQQGTRSRSRRWLGVTIAALALVAAACGSDDDGGSPDATTAAGGTGAPATSASGGGDSGDEPCVRAAFVLVGSSTDNGWNYQHMKGIDQVKEELPCAETLVLEDITEADSERVFRDLAQDGWDIIFGTTFGYMDHMVRVAPDFPDTKFEHASGFKTLDNLATYWGDYYYGAYLEGMAAGASTKTNTIGYVGAFAIPDVLSDLNAFTLGAREVNPDATVQTVWVNSWFDPPTEAQAAEALIDQGADVLKMSTSSPAVGSTADQHGLPWDGQASGAQRVNGPETFLTSAEYNWGPYYVQTLQDVIDGTWKTHSYRGNMADEFITLADLGPSLDADTKELIETRKQEIIDGKFEPFTGPITDRDGTVRIPDGEVPDVAHLTSIDYVVEGVLGDLPQS
jgi:basic membrane protein A and related proteins